MEKREVIYPEQISQKGLKYLPKSLNHIPSVILVQDLLDNSWKYLFVSDFIKDRIICAKFYAIDFNFDFIIIKKESEKIKVQLHKHTKFEKLLIAFKRKIRWGW